MHVTMITFPVPFPARKSKIERKMVMRTWDILRAPYLIALLHISNEKTRLICLKYADVALRVVRLISYSSQARSGTPLFYYVFWIPS